MRVRSPLTLQSTSPAMWTMHVSPIRYQSDCTVSQVIPLSGFSVQTTGSKAAQEEEDF